MKLLTQRKSQLRALGRTGTYVSLIALLMEMRFNPLDEFEKQFAEAYLMRLARDPKLSNHDRRQDVGVEQDVDPFA